MEWPEKIKLAINYNRFHEQDPNIIEVYKKKKPHVSLYEVIEKDSENNLSEYKYVASGDRLSRETKLYPDKFYYLQVYKPQLLLVSNSGYTHDFRMSILKDSLSLIKTIHNITINPNVHAHQYRNVEIGVVFIQREHIMNSSIFNKVKEFVFTRCHRYVIMLNGGDGKEICDDAIAKEVNRRLPGYVRDKTLVISYKNRPGKLIRKVMANIIMNRSSIFKLTHEEFKKYVNSL